MPLGAEELKVIRSWVGEDPATETLDALYDQYQNYDTVVDHVLRERLANYSLEPASLSVPGLSYSNGANIQTTEDLLARLANGGTGLEEGTPVGISTARFVRRQMR